MCSDYLGMSLRLFLLLQCYYSHDYCCLSVVIVMYFNFGGVTILPILLVIMCVCYYAGGVPQRGR